jgi:hypothetical protein
VRAGVLTLLSNRITGPGYVSSVAGLSGRPAGALAHWASLSLPATPWKGLLMASSVALRLEMHAIVLRGFERLHAIELAKKVADSVLLDARMVISAAMDDHDDDEWAPTPEEIVVACTAIRTSWDEAETERRWKFERRDFNAIREWNQQYYKEHREEILERNRDPAIAKRRAEYQREYRERCKAQLKERRHAIRAHEYALQNKRRRKARAARALACC